MLKSTKIKLYQKNVELSNQKKLIDIIDKNEEEKIKEIKRHNLSEEETKDRINISKKEYLELLESNKRYEKQLSICRETIQKIIQPLFKNGISEQLIDKIINNEVDIKVLMDDDSISLNKRIAVIYEIPYYEVLC